MKNVCYYKCAHIAHWSKRPGKPRHIWTIHSIIPWAKKRKNYPALQYFLLKIILLWRNCQTFSTKNFMDSSFDNKQKVAKFSTVIAQPYSWKNLNCSSQLSSPAMILSQIWWPKIQEGAKMIYSIVFPEAFFIASWVWMYYPHFESCQELSVLLNLKHLFSDFWRWGRNHVKVSFNVDSH